jgi:hypothetical protein
MIARDLTGALIRDSDDKPTTKYVLNKGAKPRQAERVRELTAKGYTVLDRGSGLTVFRFGER